ncbi:MAG: hypothetical protein ACRD9L_13145 [Bryobacteraceae bacterium]
MYHYDPAAALEELNEDAALPNPVHVRDMMIRRRLAPDRALEMNRQFQQYLQAFGDAQAQARSILEGLVASRAESDAQD